ncbi:MAG: ribosome biogenesis factor YjgA [Betaproteobacteria bacterium]
MKETTSEDDIDERPSKSQVKRDMLALQGLGEALVALSDERLAALDLPEALFDAVREAKRISKHGAQRRQLQYVGRIMRDVDPAPIRAQLDAILGQSRSHAAWLHRLERWRVRLLEEDEALTELLTDCPAADAPRIRALIRNTEREQREGKPPKSFRELFQVLRELMPEPAPAPSPEPSE